jgi:site-specific recombinase XerD
MGCGEDLQVTFEEGTSAPWLYDLLKNLAPHDLRHTCARLCHLAGGELEQIQFLLGYVSVQTTECYLGYK